MIRHMIAFAPSTPKLGEFNQLRGVLSGLMHFCCEDVHFAYNLDMCFENVAGGPLKRHLYADDEAFERDVFRCLDDYFSRHLLVPKVFVTICSPEDAGHAAANVDAVCRAVKDYYAAHDMGRVVTAAVNSSIYRYRFADVVHVCGHLLSEEDRQTLEADAELKRKVFVSEGIIHNMSRTFIRQKFGQPKMREIAAAYRNGRPNAVFALGGRVEGPEIRFTLSHAENIFRRMRALADKNYNVIVVNGPRTPNEVTDYFYEQSLAAESKIAFFNSKQVARTDEERVPENGAFIRESTRKSFCVRRKNTATFIPACSVWKIRWLYTLLILLPVAKRRLPAFRRPSAARLKSTVPFVRTATGWPIS